MALREFRKGDWIVKKVEDCNEIGQELFNCKLRYRKRGKRREKRKKKSLKEWICPAIVLGLGIFLINRLRGATRPRGHQYPDKHPADYTGVGGNQIFKYGYK